MLLEDHEDGGVRHAVHAAVVQDVALALLRRGTDEAGVASDEFAHEHPSQEHRVGLGVSFAVVVGIRGVPGKVAPCKDTRAGLGTGGQPAAGRGTPVSCNPGEASGLCPPSAPVFPAFPL